MRIPLYVVKIDRLSPYERGYFTVYLDFANSRKELSSSAPIYARYGTKVYSDKMELCSFLSLLSIGSFTATSVLFANREDILYEHPLFALYVRERKESFCNAPLLIAHVLGAAGSIAQYTYEHAALAAKRPIPFYSRARNTEVRKLKEEEVKDFADYGFIPKDYLNAMQMLNFAACASFNGKTDFNDTNPLAYHFISLLKTNPGSLNKKDLDAVMDLLCDYVIDNGHKSTLESFNHGAAELAIDLLYP